MWHNCLSVNFKFIGQCTQKLWNYKIKYFDNTKNIYRASGLVHDEQQFKCDTEMDILQYQTQPNQQNQQNI